MQYKQHITNVMDIANFSASAGTATHKKEAIKQKIQLPKKEAKTYF